jgi:hypothetical protein
MNLANLTSIFQAQRRQMIIHYLLTHRNPLQRTQVNILRDLGMSQATLVKYLAELKGEGLVLEKPFGTAVVYEILYDVAITKGLVNKKYEIFDYNTFLAATNQPSNQEWTGKVFNFGDMVYIYAKHRDGFAIGVPIYDKDWKELIQGAARGLNVVAFIAAIVNYFGQR